VDIHLVRLATPNPSRVLEVANQLSLLGIHADDWLSGSQKEPFDPLNVAELTISVWMRRPGVFFSTGFQGVTHLVQQPPDSSMTSLVPQLAQGLTQPSQTASYPFLSAHRVASRFIFHQRL
jgi:hypothetical protein